MVDLAVLGYYETEAVIFPSSVDYFVVGERSNKKQLTVIAWRYNLLIYPMENISKMLKAAGFVKSRRTMNRNGLLYSI